MDVLPVEVIELIFLAACCDGGRMAGSIRATCKTFRDISDACRFRTVAIASENQALSFRDAFRQASPTAQGSMRHLFVMVPGESQSGIATAEEIIRSVAQSLETLTCVVTPAIRGHLGIMLRLVSTVTQFPQLRALTLRCDDGGVLGDDFTTPEADILFPRLQYLHLAHRAMAPFTVIHRAVDYLKTCAGSHLRRVTISGGTCMKRGDLSDFREMLLFPKRQLPGNSPPCSALCPLQTYILEPYYFIESFRRGLTDLEKETREREGAIRLVLLPRCARIPWQKRMEEWLLVRAGELDPLHEWPEDIPWTGVNP